MKQILLIGNPNCGKTTIFNALTGAHQKIGNWPGVTVVKKTGQCNWHDCPMAITDLPGIYSLTRLAGETSQDGQITAQVIESADFALIINIIDTCHLERHLYLTSQIIELGKPMIIVLNMMDLAKQRGIKIDLDALAKQFNCPVLPLAAHKKIGILALKEAMSNTTHLPQPLCLKLPEKITRCLLQQQEYFFTQNLPLNRAKYYAHRLLEGDAPLREKVNLANFAPPDVDWDLILADARYQEIHQITAKTQHKQKVDNEYFTAKLDRIVLHRFWAIPLFLFIMYLMFLFAINVGGAFQDFFDLSSEAIFVKGSAWLLLKLAAPDWLIALIAYGIGRGINTTVTFIPVIAALFFFLSLLEISGYMVRAAFVVDRVMRILGLPGKAFVPMIVGFGCNVPAILAARTLDSTRDRLLTIMMSPFMSCSARLAIYTVFVAAFFPTGGHNIVFSLYLLGILMAVLTGLCLRKTIIHGDPSPLILELPAYHKPALRRLIQETFWRLRHFITRAGKLIIPICILLGGLNAINLTYQIDNGLRQTQSILSLCGQWLTPVFAPMGIHQDNWPATVGLLTGMLAKEVVVGTLNSLYAQATVISINEVSGFNLLHSLQAACWSIPQNLAHLGQAFINPIAASAADNEVSQSVYGEMLKRFDGQIGAYAYLLFVLLYVPCVSTMAVIRQEANNKWMWGSALWSCFLAYAVAVLFYQLATFTIHPVYSLSCLLCIFLCVGIIMSFMYIERFKSVLLSPHRL